MNQAILPYAKAWAGALASIILIVLTPQAVSSIAAYLGMQMTPEVATWLAGAVRSALVGYTVYQIPNKQ